MIVFFKINMSQICKEFSVKKGLMYYMIPPAVHQLLITKHLLFNTLYLHLIHLTFIHGFLKKLGFLSKDVS